MALAADSNIVGYQMHSLKAGASIMGVPWEGVQTPDGKIGLSEMIDTSKLTPFDVDNAEAGDSVQIWDAGSGWSVPYNYVDAGDIDASYADTWMDGDQVPHNLRLDPGQALCLFLKNTTPVLSFAGQVPEGGTQIVLAQGYNLLASSLPRTISLGNKSVVTISGQTPFDVDNAEAGDSVQVWDIGSGWGLPFNYVDAGDIDPSYADAWMDGDQVVVDVIAPIGSGFLYFAKKAGVTVTFKGL